MRKYVIEIETDADVVRMFEATNNLATRLQAMEYNIKQISVGEKNGNI